MGFPVQPRRVAPDKVRQFALPPQLSVADYLNLNDEAS